MMCRRGGMLMYIIIAEYIEGDWRGPPMDEELTL